MWLSIFTWAVLVGQPIEAGLPAAGLDFKPKVDIHWNRYYDLKGIEQILKTLEKTFPNQAKLHVIGESYQKRPLWILEITNGIHDGKRKSGIYIDGNIHGNEIQATEVVLYTAWYLLESAPTTPWINSLLDRVVFYLAPTINPDGRANFMANPNNMHTSRGGLIPWDEDGDGKADEDGFDDLDGDGHITMMRLKDSEGNFTLHSKDPRIMIPAEPGEKGNYRLYYGEGIDNDADGSLNEDGPGGYDPNRNWPGNWQPSHIQGGAGYYPLSLPETRAVAEFVLNHPNIAAMQSYHNAAGMILRGPGFQEGKYQPRDEQVLSFIGKKGELILPGYQSLVVWSGLYSVYGGEFDWFYFSRGIYGYTNELFTTYDFFHRRSAHYFNTDDPRTPYEFNDLLLFKSAFVDWKPYQHPQLGEIEIGGFKRNYTRVPPSFMLEQECHRNMAFTLYQAVTMPEPAIEEPIIESLGDGLTQITVRLINRQIVPTRSYQDVDNQILRPDLLVADSTGLIIVSAAEVTDKHFPQPVMVHRNPNRIQLPSIGFRNPVTIRYVVSGKGRLKLTLDCIRAIIIEREIEIS